MTDPSGLIFAALIAVVCFGPGLFVRHRRRKAQRVAAARRRDWADARREAELVRIIGQRDRYLGLYHEAVARNAALLEHIGDEREAAAAQALTETPAYFASRASVDVEWFDLWHDLAGEVE